MTSAKQIIEDAQEAVKAIDLDHCSCGSPITHPADDPELAHELHQFYDDLNKALAKHIRRAGKKELNFSMVWTADAIAMLLINLLRKTADVEFSIDNIREVIDPLIEANVEFFLEEDDLHNQDP